MTFKEIEELIEELAWTAKEVQGYLDHQFTATPEEGFELFKKEGLLIQKLKAAIKEYVKQENTVREEFDEVSGVKLSPPTEHEDC